MYFDILNHVGADHECDREANRWTDFIHANAAFHYVARSIRCAAKNWLRLARITVKYRERRFTQHTAYEAHLRSRLLPQDATHLERNGSKLAIGVGVWSKTSTWMTTE